MLSGIAYIFTRAGRGKPLALVFLLLSSRLPAQIPGLSYAPEAVFCGDPATFRLEGTGGPIPIQVLSNATEVASLTLGDVPLEFTFFPSRSTLLSFSLPEQPLELRLLRPQESVTLQEKDGYLCVENIPVVLLPDHRKPPPLDRRWETGRILIESLMDVRPMLGKILWLGPSEDDMALKTLAPLLSSAAPTPLSPDPDAWFEVHGYLLAPPPGPHAFAVIEFTLDDLERGVPPHILIMKWQFLLQRLQRQGGYGDGLLLGPDLDAVERQRYPYLPEALRSLARAHDLRFVDRTLPAEAWSSRLLFNLGKEYRLP